MADGVSYPPANVAGLQAQLEGKADTSAIPLPATMTPVGVQDSSATGSAAKYAREDRIHASKARKQIVQVATGNQDLFNVQIIGTPTNTQCTFQINRVSAGLLALLIGALSLNSTPVAATLHMIALEP